VARNDVIFNDFDPLAAKTRPISAPLAKLTPDPEADGEAEDEDALALLRGNASGEMTGTNAGAGAAMAGDNPRESLAMPARFGGAAIRFGPANA